jgi:hypothetical protein
MKFGKKVGEGGITTQPAISGDWPKGLRKGETRVRFLSEIPEWEEYWEHFDETVKFFPCTGDKNTCPGCTSPVERTAKASKRYLAPVLDPKTGKVWGLKMGIDLSNRLSLRNDRNNQTITNRDYTLIRTGDGLETEYDVEQEEVVAIDLSVYRDAIDPQDLLASQFAAAWPDFSPNGATATAAPAKATRQRRTASQLTPDEERLEKAKARAAAPPVELPDDPPSKGSVAEAAPEPEPAPQPSDGETVEITEEDLRNMGRADLVKLARQAELPVTLTMSREAIIELFLEQFAV